MPQDASQNAKELAMQANARMDTHEAVCAERYNALDLRLASGTQRMQRIEYILYGVVALLMLGEGTVIETVKRVFVAH